MDIVLAVVGLSIACLGGVAFMRWLERRERHFKRLNSADYLDEGGDEEDDGSLFDSAADWVGNHVDATSEGAHHDAGAHHDGGQHHEAGTHHPDAGGHHDSGGSYDGGGGHH